MKQGPQKTASRWGSMQRREYGKNVWKLMKVQVQKMA